MKMQKISYIISSIGKSEKLNELLNIIMENINDNELILIDNSKEGILKYLKENNNVRYYHEKESGLSNARNRGAKEATNELLVFLDDDILPNKNFFKKVEEYANTQLLDAIIGGKIIPNNIPQYLPKKYHYMVGLKNYGNKKISLPKYKYLGGCLLMMSKRVFNKLNGFNIFFGHNGESIGANEDVIIQDLAHKNNFQIIYDPSLIVKHYWRGTHESILNRLQIQGQSDCIVDKKYHKIRLVLKYIKYNLFILIKRRSNNKEDIYDIVRYKSYVQNCKNK